MNKRPANLTEYVAMLRPSRGGVWPCRECDGYGRVYDPDDPGDPIEGNKFRSRIVCGACKGSGEGTIAEWRKAFAAYRAHEAAKRKKRVAEVRAWRRIKARLTKEQWRLVASSLRFNPFDEAR